MSISTLHSGNIGDIIYALPALKELARRRDDKISLYVKCNVITTYYPGMTHPLKNVLINEDFINKLVPLLKLQKYMDKIEKYQNEPIEFNLDLFRKTIPDMSVNHIPRWYFPILKVSCDLSEPWISTDGYPIGVGPWVEPGTIVIARSSRYQNPKINYSFLRNYKCVFVGLPEEHHTFCCRFFELDHKPVVNFAELAKITAGAKLFIGNQSFPFALAEGIKVPRILEAWPNGNNVIPHGRNAYEIYCQKDFESYVKELVE